MKGLPYFIAAVAMIAIFSFCFTCLTLSAIRIEKEAIHEMHLEFFHAALDSITEEEAAADHWRAILRERYLQASNGELMTFGEKDIITEAVEEDAMTEESPEMVEE